ncbi:MAG: hypothetical protein Q8R13_06200, partial [bacterium]|nr:hypothetical protein [bacterium]
FSIIESGYLNLSVRRGFSALRLTARPGQMQDVPRVIGTIGTVNIPQQMELFAAGIPRLAD